MLGQRRSHVDKKPLTTNLSNCNFSLKLCVATTMIENKDVFV